MSENVDKWEHLTPTEQAAVKSAEKTFDVETLQNIINDRDNFRSNCCEGDSESVKEYLLLEWKEYLNRPGYVDDSDCIRLLILGSDSFLEIATFCT